MDIFGSTDIEYLARQRTDDYARRAKPPGQPPPPRRSLRRDVAARLRSLAESLEG